MLSSFFSSDFFDDLATALSLPDVPGVVAIVLGNHINEICKISWVSHSQCVYVSGIELRAFAVINNIRVNLPNAQTLTLNKDVFAANHDIWSFDDIEVKEFNSNMALTVQESLLYNMLIAGSFGRRARIPQERMPLSEIFALLDIHYEELKNDIELGKEDTRKPKMKETPNATTKEQDVTPANDIQEDEDASMPTEVAPAPAAIAPKAEAPATSYSQYSEPTSAYEEEQQEEDDIELAIHTNNNNN